MPLQRMNHRGAAVPTTLAQDFSPTDSSLVLSANGGWPTGGAAGPFGLVIDADSPTEEKVLCSAQSGGTCTVATGGRGADDTTPVMHSAGAPVEHCLFSSEVDDDNAHVYDTTRRDHDQYAPLDGADPFTGPVTFDDGITVNGGGAAITGATSVAGNASVTGGLSVGGPLTVASGGATITGPATVTGNASISGNETVSGSETVSGDITARSLALTGLGGGAIGGVRWVGTTTKGPPTSGTFLAGDWVIDKSGATFICLTAGSPGQWSVPVGGLVAQQRSPAVNPIDANNNTVVVLNLNVTLIGGCKYLVNAQHQGTVIISAPDFVNSTLSDTQSLVAGQPFFLYSLGVSAYTVSNSMGGGLSVIFAPVATVTDTIQIKVAAGHGGTYRTNASGSEVSVIRVA